MNQDKRNNRAAKFFADVTALMLTVAAGTIVGCLFSAVTGNNSLGMLSSFCVGLVGFPIAGILTNHEEHNNDD